MEINRIFPKIINPLAYNLRLHGTEGGRYTKNIIDYSDLVYNRRNWRDVAKLKGETRTQYELRAKSKIKASSIAYYKYTIQKAKKIVREYSYPKSEIEDAFANDTANHVHHIFMAADFPQIAAYAENLILLTANQHLTHAHPENNTHYINQDYQLICLTCKSATIEKSINKGEFVYSKEDFLFVIKTGLGIDLDSTSGFQEIRENLMKKYNEM